MREQLESVNGNRMRFRATVKRFGTKKNYHGYPEPTILLKNVTFVDNGSVATDHIWFTVGKTLAKLMLKPGEIVEFDARVGEYIKGYVNHREYIDEREIDYKLNRPTKFSKLEVLPCTVANSN
jgi:hypothetical protein